MCALSQLASFYDLRRADTIPELQDDFMGSTQIELTDVLEGNLNAPQSFGNLETFIIEVPVEENATVASFAFAVQAVDDAGQRSETSNVIQVTLRAYIPPPSEPNDPEKTVIWCYCWNSRWMCGGARYNSSHWYRSS